MTERIVFEQELTELMKQLTSMCRMVESSYVILFNAALAKEESEIRTMLSDDHSVNEIKRQIESMCLKLIMKQQPVATDLRTVSSVLKVVTDIERVGNHVYDMAELLLRIHCNSLDSYSLHLNGMVSATRELFANAIEAFTCDKLKDSNLVIDGDDVIDLLFNKVKTDIITGLRSESKNADEYIDMLMLAKYLEKIGDHAVNVAKWQIFRLTGDII